MSINKKLQTFFEPKTIEPKYFEFKNINTNDVNTNRFLQNTSGKTIYINQVCFYYNLGSANVNYNGWFGTNNSIQHVIDVTTFNVSHPSGVLSNVITADTFEDLHLRYNLTFKSTSSHTLGNSMRSNIYWIRFEKPIKLENERYLRLYKNGDNTGVNNYSICVSGYTID